MYPELIRLYLSLELSHKAIHPACEGVGPGRCVYRGQAARLGSYTAQQRAEDKQPRNMVDKEAHLADLKRQRDNGEITNDLYILRSSTTKLVKPTDSDNEKWEEQTCNKIFSAINQNNPLTPEDLIQLRDEAIKRGTPDTLYEIELELTRVANLYETQMGAKFGFAPKTLDLYDALAQYGERQTDTEHEDYLYDTRKAAKQQRQDDVAHWGRQAEEAGVFDDYQPHPGGRYGGGLESFMATSGAAREKQMRRINADHRILADWLEENPPPPPLSEYLKQVKPK